MRGTLDAAAESQPIGDAVAMAKEHCRSAVVPALGAKAISPKTQVVAEIRQPFGQGSERQVVGTGHGSLAAKGVADHHASVTTARCQGDVLQVELSRRKRVPAHELAVDVDLDRGRGQYRAAKLGAWEHDEIGIECEGARDAQPA